MSRRTWSAGWASLLVLGTGCDVVFGLQRIELPNSYQCECDCTTGQEMRTVIVPMLASGDDAEELATGGGAGTVFVDGSALEMTTTTQQQVIGLRFPLVPIPKNATIESAVVQFTAQSTSTVTTSLTIAGEASDDAAPFTADPSNVSARPRTASSVPWAPPSWTLQNEAGPKELTPELKAIVQEIVGRPGWDTGHALALVITGTGTRAAWSWDGRAGSSAQLRISYTAPTSVSFPLATCMPEDLDPNRDGNDNPTDDALVNDCENRVSATVNGLATACGYPACTCTTTAAKLGRQYAAACGEACDPVALAGDCSNFDPSADPPVVTATNAGDDAPVCTTHSPVASAMFGRRSWCQVEGSATMEVNDDGDVKTPEDDPTASGVVQLVGTPCPGGSCEVGVEYALRLSNVTFSNFWGSRTFTDLGAVGGTVAGHAAALDPAGAGELLPNATLSAGFGRRGDDYKAVVASNEDALGVTADWANATCSLNGAAVGTTDAEATRCEDAGPKANLLCASDADCATDADADAACSDGVCNCVQVSSTSDLTLALHLEGDLLNQPPTASAGPNPLSVECNVAGGARFVLDGRGSVDPDANLRVATWREGTRTGTPVGFALASVVERPLGTATPYVLRVIDAFGQADEARTVATVVDTTPPSVSCGTPTPATITPPSAQQPARFTATASDVCDPSAAATLSGWTCFNVNKAGKRVYRTDCRVALSGGTITITDSGGVDAHIAWTATGRDGSGNEASTQCEVVVVKPPPK